MQIGQRTTYTTTFTQEDFTRFALLSGDDNPIHVDPEFSARTKFGKTVAHGMLLYSLIERCLGTLMPGSGAVQAAQELMFPNPTYVDQQVTIILEVSALPSANTVEITTDITQSDGKSGCFGKTLVWGPRAHIEFNEVAFEAGKYDNPVTEHRGLRIGQIAEKTRLFTHYDVRDFIDLVDDRNAILSDRTYAKTRGFRDVLLPGGLLGGLVSDLLGTQLPGRGTNWLKQRFHFLAPSHPGDAITARVEVIRLRPEKDLVNLRTILTNQDNSIVVAGEALVWVSDLES